MAQCVCVFVCAAQKAVFNGQQQKQLGISQQIYKRINNKLIYDKQKQKLKKIYKAKVLNLHDEQR